MNQVERMSAPAATAGCKDAVFEHVCIRALGSEDAGRLSMFFRSLTDEARYRRFMSPVREVSDGLVLQLANADQRAHVAVAATIEDEDGVEVIVGEARYVPCDTDPDASEFALAVRDDWQGRGLGRRMLTLLERRASIDGLKKTYRRNPSAQQQHGQSGAESGLPRGSSRTRLQAQGS